MAARFEIRVNQRPFRFWETAQVERSLDTNSGSFSFDSTNKAPDSYPVRVGDFVQVLVNGIPQVTGHVDVVDIEGDVSKNRVSVGGRDTTQDLIDSSVPDGAKTITGPISLVAMCERVISALGSDIEVQDVSQGVDLNFTQDDLLNADSGRGCMNFLTDFARKKQVYLIPDGVGRLLVFRPNPAERAATALQHTRNGTGNNVKEFRASFNAQDRFGVYVSRSQDLFSFGDASDYKGDGVDRNDRVEDPTIRSTRYLEIQGEETLSGEEPVNRVEEEANLRRIQSILYEATVAGVEQSDGSVWRVGQLVRVNDEFAGVRGILLIRAIRFSISEAEGSRTRLLCSPPDAYQVRGATSDQDARRALLGANFFAPAVATPPRRFAR